MTHTIETAPATLPPLPPERLLAIARGLGRDATTWRALARHDPRERWFLQLTNNPRFDVWLIGWHGHQGVDLHDHGGSAGAFVVVEGTLLEVAGSLGGDGLREDTRLGVGAARAFGAGHVHRVVNPSPDVATSVHVYSPPLQAMDFYAAEPDRSFTRLWTSPAHAPRDGAGELRLAPRHGRNAR